MTDESARAASQPESRVPRSAKEPLAKLTLGQARASPVVPKAHSHPAAEAENERELESLAASCREKGEAARWAAERERRLREWDEHPDDDAPTDPAIQAWAETLTNAYYWAVADDRSDSIGIAALDQVGGCFETLAECLALVEESQQRRGGLDRALQLLAEAQSALRGGAPAASSEGRPAPDGGLRVVTIGRRPTPRLSQAIHASRRPRRPRILAETAQSHRG